MSYAQKSLKDLVSNVLRGEIVLPSLQRSFVWDEKKICRLFDSLMKGYPIGQFVFWEINQEEIRTYNFRKIVYEINKNDKANDQLGNRVEIAEGSQVRLNSVLDGQQRLTSLMIGLKGYFVPKSRKKLNPIRYLALNVRHVVEDITNDVWDLKFLTDTEIEDENFKNDPNVYWVKVRRMLEEDVLSILTKIPDANSALPALQQLNNALHNANVAIYTIPQGKNLPEIAQIFERINNSGQTLSGVDLMLSLIAAHDGDHDMQIKINEALELIKSRVNELAFVPSNREFFFTTALYLTDAEKISTSVPDSYKTDVLKLIADSWDEIVEAICNASMFMWSLGFGNGVLKSSVHPVIYYFYNLPKQGKGRHEKIGEEYAKDRHAIAQWLIRSSVTHLFVDGSGGTLLKIRDILRRSIKECTNKKELTFPIQQLRETFNDARTLEVSDEHISKLLDLKYTDSQTLPLLKQILGIESVQKSYHVDHIWPVAKMKSIATIKSTGPTLSVEEREFFKKNFNNIANLQLLSESENKQKQDKLFDKWLNALEKDRGENGVMLYKQNQLIPEVDFTYANFMEFYKQRRQMIEERIKSYFSA